MLLFRALARNMAPMKYHEESTLPFLNEVAPLCSLYSLSKVSRASGYYYVKHEGVDREKIVSLGFEWSRYQAHIVKSLINQQSTREVSFEIYFKTCGPYTNNACMVPNRI